MTTMYKNELFILMYCVQMIPTGRNFHKFSFSMINDERAIFDKKGLSYAYHKRIVQSDGITTKPLNI